MSLPYGDPEELERMAKALDGYAAEVRASTTAQLKRADAAEWVSAAKTAYCEDLAKRCRQADRAAQGIEEAAAALRAHAARIRALLVAIDRIEQAVTEWFASARRKFEELVAAGQAGSTPTVPWFNWPVRPETIPPPGDKRWLDVGKFMRGMGVL